MKKVVKKASPAAIAVLRQATALFPKRKKASDGLLPSLEHIKQSPKSDHNSGLAVDLTHDPDNGVDCAELFVKLRDDKRVLYLIYNGRIWLKGEGEKKYTGPNPHVKHLHISIQKKYGTDTSPWFPWAGEPKAIGKAVAKVSRLKKKTKKS